ncbi:MAG: FAD-dependent oxidoreductase [Raoultibacter sp.]
MSSNMKRRDFLKSLGMGAGVIVAAGSLSGCAVKQAFTNTVAKTTNDTKAGDALFGCPAVKFSSHVDVLIIGSGIAGFSAAIDPLEAKMSVLLVDKQELLGGESYVSNGLFTVEGTDIQHKAGLFPSTEEAWSAREAGVKKTVGSAGLAFQKKLFFLQTQWVNRVSTDYGAKFADPSAALSQGCPKDILLPEGGIGNMESVLAPLRDSLADKGLTTKLDMHAIAFIVDESGCVIGMRLKSEKTGDYLDVRASKIVMATGGFADNQEMIAANVPDQTETGCLTTHSAGSGILLCKEVGGQLTGMDRVADLIGDVPPACVWGLFGPVVHVSPQGRRFAPEDDRTAAANRCQNDELGYWWTIFDKQLLEGPEANSLAKTLQKNASRKIGPLDTLEDLARAMDIPPDTLKTTFTAYDQSVSNKKDDQGRTHHLKSLSSPYYAIKQFPKRYKTLGGAATSENGELLDAGGAPIDNVYCCGACAQGNLLGLASAAAFGLCVGQAIAQTAPEK